MGTDYPREYDYSHPTLRCDVVMKGGVTSGIVYPLAVCELAQTYRLKNVGGTSAGAIAAAAAAAAELGRHSRSGGFRRFAELPDRLAAGTNLVDLFRPEPKTRPLFRVLTAGIGSPRPTWRIVIASVQNFWLPAALGILPGLILIAAVLVSAQGFLRGWGVISGVLLAVCGALLGVAAGMILSLMHDVPANLFGLCSGIGDVSPSKGSPLTTWLASELNILAGRRPDDPPLVFGDLWTANKEGQTGIGPGRREINLAMVTTNITQGRPQRVPFGDRVWFFDVAEMRRLFPEGVVRWMLDNPPPPPDTDRDRRHWELLCTLMFPLRPLPAAAALPVVVATRLSLSFPLLISAVPLWSVDWSLKVNQKAGAAWRRWVRRHWEIWDGTADKQAFLQQAGTPPARLKPGRCWFSDGGITSNFPVHFFDTPLPRWPTFAINLRPFHPDFQWDPVEARNVWMPTHNRGGIAAWWTPIDPAAGRRAIGGFLRAIVDTAMNWTDNTQLRVPGYRDRVAHIQVRPDEGGLNLRMSEARIRALSERGRAAGDMLGQRFGVTPPPGTALTWDNHRWVRYRTIMALIEPMLARFRGGFNAVPSWGRSYREMVDADRPPSYGWTNRRQHDLARDATQRLLALTRWWRGSANRLATSAPRPRPELRVRPRI